MVDRTYLTAMSRNSLSLPMKWLRDNGFLGGKCLDFGCGRGYDSRSLKIDCYDPYWTKGMIESPDGGRVSIDDVDLDSYNTITCIYVMNVIPSKFDRDGIVVRMRNLLTLGGTIYVAVRRDVKIEGYNSKGNYQANVSMDFPVLVEFPGKFCIYSINWLKLNYFPTIDSPYI